MTCYALQGLASYQDHSWGFSKSWKNLLQEYIKDQTIQKLENNFNSKVYVIRLCKCLKLFLGISLPLTKELTSSQALAKENQKLDLASKTEAHNQ